MKTVTKKKLKAHHLLLIIMLSALAAVIGLWLIVRGLEPKPKDQGSTTVTEIYDYEDRYLNVPIAYSKLEDSEISYLIIKNDLGTFDMTRWPDTTGAMWISYSKGNGIAQMIQYIPPIVGEENDFDYETLYAIENNDGYGMIYMLTYLMTAIGTPYFNERIELPPVGDAERDVILNQFGLNTEDATIVSYKYTDKDSSGKVVADGSRRILVGNKPVSGTGYYYMVEEPGINRNFVYYTSNDYFDYALLGVEAFIKGMLVSEGAPGDSTYEPYLTTDFKQWVNTLHKEEGERVTEGANVITHGMSLTPINKGADYVPPEGAPTDGYTYSDYLSMSFDLEAFKSHPDYQRIRKHLVGLGNGMYYDGNSSEAVVTDMVLLTLISSMHDSPSKLIDFTDKQTLKYTYGIWAVESIITDTEELDEEGTPVGDRDLIKVSYYYKIDGVNANSVSRHGIIDLSEDWIPEEVRASLRAASIGELDTHVTFDMEYSVSNSRKSVEKLIVSDIAGIFDKDGRSIKKIEADSYVSLRYYEVIDGVATDKQPLTVRLSDIEEGSKWEPLKTLLIGKSVSAGLELEVFSKDYYYEYIKDFITYQIWSVDYFITSEMVSSFRFVNASMRDPYYGESYYENTIGNSYKLYGLNAASCEAVVKILGGVGATSNSETEGFFGTTVALGLSHENMEKYGLYAYKIYFELPRGLYDITEGTEADDEDVLSDFDWHDTLGFTLYISEEDPVTGNRYVGSDMYDLIAEVDGSKLEFLDFSFVDFWARRNLVLMDVTRLEKVRIELMMEDVKGEYLFDIDVRQAYVGYINGKSVITYDRTVFDEAGVTPTKVDQMVNTVYQYGDCMDTLLSEYLEMNSEVLTDGGVRLSALYNYYINLREGTTGTHFVPGTVDSEGDANFKEMFEIFQLTDYQGTISPEEQIEAFKGAKVMSLHIKMDSSGFYYTYDFYRYSDRRVMVSIYRSNESGVAVSAPVSDFYLSTFAFKKMVNAVISVLNVVEVDTETPYADAK